MPRRKSFRVKLNDPAVLHIDVIAERSLREFGEEGARRYWDLMMQALEDLEQDPHRIGLREIAGAPAGVLAYHLAHSRERARSALGVVKKPRHFVVYRLQDNIVDVLRILHDSRDLARRLDDAD